MPGSDAAFDIVDAVYLMSVLIDEPRWIDRYIDYFGGGAGAFDLRRGESRRPHAR
jgi:hypothetical protein